MNHQVSNKDVEHLSFKLSLSINSKFKIVYNSSLVNPQNRTMIKTDAHHQYLKL